MPTTFFDSVYKYTDPVRYFKANDPYYYEVDNIPLKQLQENCNFLKDQIAKIANISDEQDGVFDRSKFSELQPYVDETGNVVRVRPGRYTARINDAYTVDPLQFVTQTLGFDSSLQDRTYSFKTNKDSSIREILNKFRSTVASGALNMNGLYERIFTYPVDENGRLAFSPYGGSATIGQSVTGTYALQYPNILGSQLWAGASLSSYTASPKTISPADNSIIYDNRLEAEFIRKWRGVTRTAIVDVPEELEISIPPFSEDDFYYINESGQRQPLYSNHRIDLVFIYSKPIDASKVSINDRSPRQINKPVLGVLKGAGLGVNLKQIFSPPGPNTPINGSDTRLDISNLEIISNYPDELSVDTGFSGIKGSFPSPDDLLNIAPLLSENIESTNFALIGQSILPVAYVVVRRNAPTNSESNSIIYVTDLYDIRPFFRTTELSYNERSGLAAAVPQVSLANPVASENYVDNLAKKLQTRIELVNSRIPDVPTVPRIVGTGYIRGGSLWGVEGTLRHFINQKFNLNSTALTNKVKDYFGYPSNFVLRSNPDWDLARWTSDGDLRGPAPGLTRYDHINFSISHIFNDQGCTGESQCSNSVKYYPNGGSQPLAWPVGDLSNDDLNKFATWPNTRGFGKGGYYSFYYVSKTIRVNKTLVPWMEDFYVEAQLFNCVPLSNLSDYGDISGEQARGRGAGISNIWYSKRKISEAELEFTIFVGWTADTYINVNGGGTITTPKAARVVSRISGQESNSTSINTFASFAVINKAIMSETGNRSPGFISSITDISDRKFIGDTAVGIALYPTVQFSVIGIPSEFNPGREYSGVNPVIELR